MSVDISTLVDDIYAVLGGRKAPSPIVDDITSNAEFAKRVLQHIHADLVPDDRSDRNPNEVYVTQMSHPCQRKAWFETTKKYSRKEDYIAGHTKYKFLYGDLIEESFLYLAKAAGHDVSHTQHRYEMLSTKTERVLAGRIDAIIDGWIVDVKSCDPFTFDKVVAGKYDDKFGYREQLLCYALMHKRETGGQMLPIANIFVNKINGKMYVHKYAYDTTDLTNIEWLIEDFYAGLSYKDNPFDTLPLIDDNKLSTTCAYCPFKFECFPRTKVFAYASGPEFYSDTDKKIKVPDITGAYKLQHRVS